jgi:hypothetical protein
MESKDNFQLSRSGIRDYSSRHKYAQMMFVGAGDDYAASRCLNLNMLTSSGFPLFSQSVEKLLKAILFLETGSPTTLKSNRDKHNPLALKQELQGHADYGLDKYDDLLKRLYGHFQHRYFDNPNQSRSMNGEEIDEFDSLWVYLFDQLRFPTEVKYRLKVLAMLFDREVLQWMPHFRHWVIYRNKALEGRLPEMEETYLAVEHHYINSK